MARSGTVQILALSEWATANKDRLNSQRLRFSQLHAMAKKELGFDYGHDTVRQVLTSKGIQVNKGQAKPAKEDPLRAHVRFLYRELGLEVPDDLLDH